MYFLINMIVSDEWRYDFVPSGVQPNTTWKIKFGVESDDICVSQVSAWFRMIPHDPHRMANTRVNIQKQ